MADNHFGAPDGNGLRANDADTDGDGVSNLVEYLTGTDPALAESALNTAGALTVSPLASFQAPVKFTLVMDNAALTDSRVRVTIQQSENLNTWTTQTSRTGGGSWTGPQPLLGVEAPRTLHIFPPGFTAQEKPRLYVRLKAEELP